MFYGTGKSTITSFTVDCMLLQRQADSNFTESLNQRHCLDTVCEQLVWNARILSRGREWAKEEASYNIGDYILVSGWET